VNLTIDNLDGLGAVDYSAAIDASAALKIDRTLNEPSRCTGVLSGLGAPGLGSPGLGVPVRRGRIVVTADSGTVLFTGYIATTPEALYAGVGTAGPLYRVIFAAISDEWLLDRQTTLFGNPGLGATAGQIFKTLVSRSGGAHLGTANVQSGRPVGVFEPEAGANWSANAGSVASAAYSAYRALGGALTLEPAGTVTHALSDGDGTLQIGALKTASVKELANDVTVSGGMEPSAYVTELFHGDGTTEVFLLAGTPFVPAHTANTRYLINDSFNNGSFDPKVWTLNDPGAHLGLSGNGLQMSGGNGFDGQTRLTAIDSMELGGTLVVEAGHVQLSGANDGVLCGLYSGAISRANCFAGYNVRQDLSVSPPATIVTPFVQGAEAGTSFTLQPGHVYTLRLRLHCAELQRVMQTYYAMVEGVVEAFGGGLVEAPMDAVFELVDLGLSSNTPAVILYDTASAGPITGTPASCLFAAVDSVQLFGSMGYCRVQQTGSVWITSTLPSGAASTRLIGVAGEGVDCHTSLAGRITFFAGRIPVANERITVTYRSRQRAVARLEDPASVAREALGGAPGTAAWLGHVLQPAARSTADCESAAQAILSFASAGSAALAGTYLAASPQLAADVWPGDLLALTAHGSTSHVLVRKVEIVSTTAFPELLTYKITFANDWAEGLGVKLSESVAVDALLPQTALTGPANVLATLLQLTVVSATATLLQIDSGIDPPPGGGFEVRRRDFDFGPTVDQDLVLRSPVRAFQIPRSAQVEQYFIRMYDASTPPVYSRYSSAIHTDVPVS
jgi:hypothetical protein